MGQVQDNYGPNPEPYPIKLERCQKGGDGWKAAISGNDPASIPNTIREVDKVVGIAQSSVTFIREEAKTPNVQKSPPFRARMHRHCRYFGIERGDTALASSLRRWILDAPPN